MAWTGGIAATYGAATSVIAEDVSNRLSLYSRMETPFLDFIGDSNIRATQLVHSWLEDALRADSTTMNDSGGISDSDATITVTSSAPFSAGDLIMIDDEIIRLDAIDSTTVISCAGGRGWGTSAAASHSDGVAIYKISSAGIEGADVGTAHLRDRTVKTNYCQIIEPAPVVVSLEQDMARKNGGVGNETDHQLRSLYIEFVKDLERACLYSTKASSSPGGSSTQEPYMEGLRWFVSTNAFDASSATLSEDYWKARLVDIYTNGGKNIDFAIMNAFQKNKVDSFKQSSTRARQDETTWGGRVTVYEHSFSNRPMTILLSPWLRNDEILFGDSDNIDIVPFVPVQEKRLAESGFYTKVALHGSYTLEARHEESIALIKNLATS